MADVRHLALDESRSGADAADLALGLVGSNKEVLGIGCGSTSLTERLAQQGCTVVAVDVDDDDWDGTMSETFDVVLLTGALARSADPHRVIRRAARKVKHSGVLVAWLPNAAHGDSSLAIKERRFHYGGHGLLEGPQVEHFTLDAIREMFVQAGLVIVDTARVVVPLVETQFAVTRDEAQPEQLHDSMDDPEVETYEFVLRAVPDNGDRALADLARRVEELSARARDETARTAVLRAELWQKEVLSLDLERHRTHLREQQQAIEAQQRYIEALKGHVSGLEHNIEVLTQSLEELRRSSDPAGAEDQIGTRRRTARATPTIRRIADRLASTWKRS